MIKPLRDFSLIKPDTVSDTTKGGIVITAELEQPQTGTVVASGPSAPVKDGARVYFSKYGPEEVKYDGEDYLMVRREQIMGIL